MNLTLYLVERVFVHIIMHFTFLPVLPRLTTQTHITHKVLRLCYIRHQFRQLCGSFRIYAPWRQQSIKSSNAFKTCNFSLHAAISHGSASCQSLFTRKQFQKLARNQRKPDLLNALLSVIAISRHIFHFKSRNVLKQSEKAQMLNSA